MPKRQSQPRAPGPKRSAHSRSVTQSKSVSKPPVTEASAGQHIDQRLRALAGWRGETLAQMRSLILATDPQIVEEWKWSNPVWSQNGILCTGEAYAQVVKLTFAQGANVPDPSRLFNASLNGNTRRAIDIREGETIDAAAFQTLVRAAIAFNGSLVKKPPTRASQAAPVKLLSGGNPQIAKGYGDEPVQAYIAAMPGWKGDIGRRLDSLIEKTIPDVYKAVKWNTPFYGHEGAGWYVAFHCMTKYIKVTFFRGTSLRPVPPVESKQPEVRYLHVYEHEPFDEAQFIKWVQQASTLPGEKL